MMKAAETVRDKLKCPKCSHEFTKIRHQKPSSTNSVTSCPKCSWNGCFHYV